MKQKSLAGRWAFVSGASRGIGKLVAGALAKEGANLILHSRSASHTAGFAKELRSQGTEVHEVYAELSDENAVKSLIKQIMALCPSLDIVYNNAAIMTPYHADWLNCKADEYQLSFMVNTIAPIMISNAFLPGMLARSWGRIVNVTSGIQDQPELMAYAASKAALDKYVRDMAPKLKGTGVAMNLLDPGWLKTDLGGAQAPNEVETVLPGALVPVLLEEAESGILYRAQDYKNT